MRIAIDARMYGTAQRGIGRYLQKLLEHLERVDTKNHYTIFLRRANWDEHAPRNPNFTKALWDAPWYGLREQLSFRPLFSDNSRLDNSIIRGHKSSNRLIIQSSNINIYHFPHWNVPLFFKRPFIVTIHDLELFSSNRSRESTTRGRLTYWTKFQAFKIIFRHAVLTARAIIVPSNTVKEQLLDMYPQVRNKVQVIYEAPALAHSSQLTAYSLVDKPYILYVGAAYPHKNLARLLEAWEDVHKEFPEHKLVLVGREDFFWQRLKSINSRFQIPDSIIFYGPATDDELAALYSHASLLIQPSLAEGFSLPPLEALSFGCPVAVSDIPVHHEILGNAALFFDPHDPHAMAAAIKEVLTNAHTHDRILHHAKSQLLRYSWRGAAQKTLQVYETVRNAYGKVQ